MNYKSAEYQQARALYERPIKGQVVDLMYAHPEWFTEEARAHQSTIAASVAKRIIGEIVIAQEEVVIPSGS